jgi:hypothetical protein
VNWFGWTTLGRVRGSPSRRERPSPNSRYLMIWSTWIAVPVAVVSMVALVAVATSSVRQTEQRSESGQAAAWNLDNRYWSCLETQARSLVQPEEHVWIDPSIGLGNYVNLEFILSPWVVLVHNQNQARAWLTLRTSRGPGTCLNWEVEGRIEGPGGTHTALRKGTGASLFSTRPLPTTPL